MPPIEKKKKKRSGKSIRAYGHDFEREVSHAMREVFDSPEWHRLYESAPTGKDKKKACSLSVVQRGQQSSGGGREPDVMIPVDWWLELGAGEKMDIVKKHQQGIRDVKRYQQRTGDMNRYNHVAAIVKLRNTSRIRVLMRYESFFHLFERGERILVARTDATNAIYLDYERPTEDDVVEIDYPFFLKIFKQKYGNGQTISKG